ncbi:DoxX family protein [Amycolatopsis sp. K13G38]|uniref:DoxX family protein n=1 Tax=Amycolatopsis acididurans TaxID=2724524 RepID=A0ABX1JJS9_9PSEU|nr:DoxX family protein [Amycolatopsis acididurans]NKQ58507.1 DoxX family protein [Amycolatopsis acididurans]
MILRRLARPLLASIFIYGGIGALKQTEYHAQAAKPLIDKTVGKQQAKLPDAVPTDAETLVRIDAAVKIVAGSMFAFGKMPRLSAIALIGSLVPTSVAGHPFWEAKDEGEKQQQLIHFLKNAGLAGGLLIAAADTEGKPSLGWRARRAAKQAGKQVEAAKDKLPG